MGKLMDELQSKFKEIELDKQHILDQIAAKELELRREFRNLATELEDTKLALKAEKERNTKHVRTLNEKLRVRETQANSMRRDHEKHAHKVAKQMDMVSSASETLNVL